jgi:streptogramin lyase
MTITGDSTSGWRDGYGTQSKVASPYSVAVDSVGVVYISDYANHVIRMVNTSG